MRKRRKLARVLTNPGRGKDVLMQTHRARRLVSLALGATAVFDVTGAVIYRAVRAGLPALPDADSAASPFRQATQDILEARREAITQASGGQGVSPPA